MSDGIAPTLAELVALRDTARRGPGARRGRFGVSGQARSPSRGRGMEYAESRDYSAGDDARHIDWRLTARTGRAHTKLFQAERERMTLLVADTAPALYFGSRVRFKSVQAARAGAVAAWHAVREGDRVAALRGARAEAPVTPAGGTRGVLRVLDALATWYAHSPRGDEGLAFALDRAARLLRPGSRVLVLADAASVDAVPAVRWTALARHNEVGVLMLTDGLEQSPPHELLEFGQGDARVRLDLADPAQRARWNARFVQPVQRVLDTLPARGVRVHALRADAASDEWLGLMATPRIEVA